MGRALVGLSLLAAGMAVGSGCHELGKFERWKNQQLFGRPTCLPHRGPPDECCEVEGEFEGPGIYDGPGPIGEVPGPIDGGPGPIDGAPIYMQ